jgi:hypothetical protein
MNQSMKFEWETVPSDVVRWYFSRAIGTLETGQSDTLTASLHRRGWQRGVDLRGVGDYLIDRTEQLAKAALGALSAGRTLEAKSALQEAHDLW